MHDVVKIVSDFHPYPAGRYPDDGEGNGTKFREEFLVPAIKDGRHIIVDLDGAPGYPSSFLEEAFGGLVREDYTPELIRKLLEVRASRPGYVRYIRRIWEHIDRAYKLKLAGGH